MVWNMDFVDKDCSNFDDFIDEALVPLSTHIDAFKKITEDLTQFLKNKTSLKIRRVVKGGSLERGTSLKGRMNSEVILVLDDFRSVPDMKAKIPDVLAQIKRCLNKYGNSIKDIKSNKLSVTVKALVDGGWSPIWISPVYEGFNNATSTEELHYQTSHNVDLNEYFSIVSKERYLQIFQTLPMKLKNLMRLVYHWNLKASERHDQEPLSEYFIEAMVIWCWKRSGVLDNVETTSGMKTVLQELTKGTKLSVDWQGIELIEDQRPNYNKKSSRNPHLPVVVDPVNQSINLCELPSYGISFWERISKIAMDTNKLKILNDAMVWNMP